MKFHAGATVQSKIVAAGNVMTKSSVQCNAALDRTGIYFAGKFRSTLEWWVKRDRLACSHGLTLTIACV